MEVYLTKEAQGQYEQLTKSEKNKIEKKINLLQADPFAGKKLSGEYKNLRSLKAWPYRIIYLINEKKEETWIVSIIHRQGAYRK